MKKYVALFVIAFVIFIAVKAPVTLLQEEFPQYKLNGKIIDGTAYSPEVGAIEFTFLPMKLFTGMLAYELVITKDDSKIFTTAGIDLFGDIVISDTSGLITLNDIKRLNIPQLTEITPLKMVDAHIKINKLFVIIEDKISLTPSMIEGNFDIIEANILGERVGNYNMIATLDSSGNSVQIRSNQEAVFDIDASVDIMSDEVVIRGDIKGRDEDSTQLLTNFGIKDTLEYTFKL